MFGGFGGPEGLLLIAILTLPAVIAGLLDAAETRNSRRAK